MHAKKRVPNRWLIAAMCTVLQLCLGTVYAWSYFQPLLVEQFRWTNTETSWAFSLTICCLGLSAAWGGINLARIGPRRLAIAGGLLFAAGSALAAIALELKSLTLFYLGYGAVAGIGIGLGYVTPMSTVTKWFPDKKGLMTGIVAMGFGLGAFILSVLLAPILMYVFHRNLAPVFAALGAILGSAAFGSAAMLKDPPADYLPSGYVPSAAKDAFAAGPYAKAEEESDLPLKEYLLAGQYAIMWFIFFQHHGWHLDRQLPLAAVPGHLETQPPYLRALYSGQLWRHADRSELFVQRLWAHCVGRRVRKARPHQHVSSPARLAANCVWHLDDGAQSMGLRYTCVLCAELLRWRLRDHAAHDD
jgi:MFS family permease